MNKASRAFILVAVTAVLAGCGGTPDEDSASPSGESAVTAVASHYPVEFLVSRIGGDAVAVDTLTAPGAEPHDVELTPQQVASLQDSDTVFYISGYQPAVDDAVGGASNTVVDLSDGLASRVSDEQSGTDPHIWLDPTLMSAMAVTVADTLTAADPDNAATFRANAESLQEELATLDEQWAAGTANCESRTMVVNHEAFGYLADRYGFDQKGISGLSPENEPSAEAIAELTEFVRNNNVSTVYTETLVDPAVAETIAAETGASTAVLDPIEGLAEGSDGDYLSIMADNLETLRAGQACS